jgi:hypothetical protein
MPIRASAEAFGEQWSKNCQVTMQFRHLGLSELLERILLAMVSARAADLFALALALELYGPLGHLAAPPGYSFDIVNVTVHFRKRHKQKSLDVA